MATVSVLIPAFNEAERVGATINAIISLPEITEILVIDDASTDRTAELAKQAGARVIRLEHNRGKGGALNYGARQVSGEVVALIDADLGQSAREVIKLLGPVLEGRADMTVARFPRTGTKAGFGLVKGLACRGIKILGGVKVEAPLSGQRVMHRGVLEAVLPFAAGYGIETGMTIDAARRGFKILEIETQMSHAATGRDWRGFMHRGRQFWHVLKILTRKSMGG